MSYNAKNYTEQGGEKTVIGGTLEIKEGATVTGLYPRGKSGGQRRRYRSGAKGRFQRPAFKAEGGGNNER